MGEVYRYRRLMHGPPRGPGSGSPRSASGPARRRRDFLPTLGITAAAFVASAFMVSLLLEDATSPLGGAAAAVISGTDAEQARFTLCVAGRGTNCVIDGDTFRYEGNVIRIADIDTPEVRDYGCASEKVRGDAATARLLALINAGPFTLAPYERDRDRYGRALRIVTRDGRSLGMTLVAEGLAREWDGARRGWC